MDWDNKLLDTPVDQWKVEQVLVLEYYDGPIRGWCALTNPGVEFAFDCIDEQHNSEGMDLRTFRIKELPSGTVTNAVGKLAPMGPPRKPSWCPIWKFPSEEIRKQLEALLEEVESQARPTELLVSSADMESFAECWRSQPDLLPERSSAI